MRRLGEILLALWRLVVWIFERSDIIPPLIVVSVWHYAGALSKHDPPIVAAIIGVLVDLGQYRAVKSYLRTLEKKRFAVMAMFTAMTGYFHYLWYRDILLAIALPLLIIGLALLSLWERWEEKQSAGLPNIRTKKPAAGELPPRQIAGELPKHAGGWRQLTAEERAVLLTMTAVQVAAKYNIPERTARDWRAKAKKEIDA